MTQLIGGTQPIGSIAKAPYNMSDANWLRCDNSPVVRATYPNLSTLLPSVGVFTPSVATPAASTGNFIAGSVCSNGTSIVVPATTGTSGIQVSTNGGTSWATETTPASFQCGPIVYTGTNFAAMDQSAGAPLYSPTGITWTAATGMSAAVTSAASNGAGTVIALSGSTAYISTNNGQTYTATTTQAFTAGSVIYTGTQFLIFSSTGTVQASTAGTSGTWSLVSFLPWGTAAVQSAASDGANNVLVVFGGAGVLASMGVAYISKNGGSTWTQTVIPGLPGTCSYSNGRFFVTIDNISTNPSCSAVAVSADLHAWAFVPSLYQAAASSTIAGVAFASSQYVIVNTVGITIATEDTTKMYLPAPDSLLAVDAYPSSQTISSLTGYYQTWIKVQ